MRFIKQKTTIAVNNMDLDLKKSQEKRHGVLLPNSIRAIIVGSSGSGKTNLMISLLEEPNGLVFENIYVFSKSLYQPKYVQLQKNISSIAGMGYFPFSNADDVISPNDALPHSIMIFDDVATQKQSSIRDYFSMGRHCSIDSFYLSQTYSTVPKQLIRDNANMIIMFRQNVTNLKHVFNDHIASDMAFEMFSKICAECWKDRYGFIVVDLESCINNGRYRRGFNDFIIINENNS